MEPSGADRKKILTGNTPLDMASSKRKRPFQRPVLIGGGLLFLGAGFLFLVFPLYHPEIDPSLFLEKTAHSHAFTTPPLRPLARPENIALLAQLALRKQENRRLPGREYEEYLEELLKIQ